MRNSQERCAELRPELAHDAAGSLHEIGVTAEQAKASVL
jgi:hypothetical protein